jgi:signal transduction histidine kinase
MDSSDNKKDKKRKEYPIRPTFISLRHGIDERASSLNYDGIYTLDLLKGFLADASQDEKIKSPLALYQIVPDSLKFTDPEPEKIVFVDDYFKDSTLKHRKFTLIHSGKFYENNKLCLIFRNDDKGKRCFELDSRIALLYDTALADIDYNQTPRKYLEQFKKVIDNYNSCKGLKGNEKLEVNNKTIKGRFFVHYSCKYSHFEEFFIPIIAAGRVVAVLMWGQRIPEGLKMEGYFAGHRSTAIEEAIKAMNGNEFDKDSMSEDGFKALSKRITKLERRIEDRIKAATDAYISKSFSEIELFFRDKIKKLDRESPSGFMTVLDKTLQRICSKFGYGDGDFIRIFGNKSVLDSGGNIIKCELIGASSAWGRLAFAIPNNNEISVDWPPDTLKDYGSSDVQNQYNSKTDSLYVLDTTPFTKEMPYIIWERNKKGISDDLRKTVRTFYHTLLEPYAIFKGVIASETLEKSTRIAGHESSQMVATLIDVVEHDFLKLEEDFTYSLRNTDKPLQKLTDIATMLSVLEGVYRRPLMIFKKKTPEEWKWEDLFRLLKSMNTFFDEKARRNNRQQVILGLDKELHKYFLYTNDIFFKHIMYNLLDNAVKYGYRASNILIDGVRTHRYNKEFFDISVTSYGIEIPEKNLEDIFDLNFRVKSPEVEGVQGMGIGMFVTKSLCQLLGYDIKCSSNMKAEYHIPVHYHFQKIAKKNKLLDMLQQERKDDIIKILETFPLSDEIIDKVVNKNINKSQELSKRWDLGISEATDLASKKTYENVFTISIPIDKNNFTDNTVGDNKSKQ